MASAIDDTKPETGVDQPVKVIRDNFVVAKGEIETLQAGKVDKTGDALSGVLKMAPFTLGTLPTASSNAGGLIYVTDASGGPTIAFSNATDWISLEDGSILS